MSDAIMLGFIKLGKLSNKQVFGLIELYELIKQYNTWHLHFLQLYMLDCWY